MHIHQSRIQHLISLVHKVISTVFFLLILIGCGDNSEEDPTPVQSVDDQKDVNLPTISVLAGNEGIPGSEIKIWGTNFSTNPTNNIVEFMDGDLVVAGTINDGVTAKSTEIRVFVPDISPGQYQIKVTVGENSTIAEDPFTLLKYVKTLSGGAEGYIDGNSDEAKFGYPGGSIVGPDGFVYVADRGNNSIRKVSFDGEVTTVLGSDAGFVNGDVTIAKINTPNDIAFDSEGNLIFVDQHNHAIRKLDAAGNVITIAGTGSQGFVDGPGTEAQFRYPTSLTIDGNNTIYVSDNGNNSIRKITSDGMVTTFAGSLQGEYGFNDGTGTEALFASPSGIACDATANLYVADQGNQRIRKITPQGVVTTFAGNGVEGYNGGSGEEINFNDPTDVAMDIHGNLYINDQHNRLIRAIGPDGMIYTVAGKWTLGFQDGLVDEAIFGLPKSITVDPEGNNIFVMDENEYTFDFDSYYFRRIYLD